MEWTNITKSVFGLFVIILILDCFVILALFGFVPESMRLLINDFSSEFRINLIYLLIAIVIFGLIFPFIFLSEAAKIHYTQKKIITERLPDQLVLSVERTPNILFTKDEKREKVAALFITSREKKKIIELRALINFEHFYYVADRGYVGETGYQLNTPLFWEGEGSPTKEIELRPDTGKVVIICELLLAKKNGSANDFLALMEIDPTPISSRFGEESIFQIKIRFQGKLEGEYDFRTFHFEDVVYTKPQDQRILFLDNAEKSYPDIPNKLLERSKSVIKYTKMRKMDKKA